MQEPHESADFLPLVVGYMLPLALVVGVTATCISDALVVPPWPGLDVFAVSETMLHLQSVQVRRHRQQLRRQWLPNPRS
jgi:hypothetical protein